jgi:HSP20 family protein
MSELSTVESAPATRESRPNPSKLVPAVNIHQDSEGYLLEVEIPGVAKDGVEVSFEDGKLILIGRKKPSEAAGKAVYQEIPRADYRRVFDLDPSIDASRIEATVNQGLLKVRLPKAEAAKPRRIDVS